MPVNVAFVGCGGNNSDHMSKVAANPEAEICAVCDLDETKAQSAAEEHGVRAFTDQDEMIAAEDIDAAFVSVPPFAHGDIEMALAEAGINMLIEKPVALDLELARDIQAAIEDNDLVSTAGFQDRYLDVLDRTRTVLKENDPGVMLGYWMGGMPGVAWWRVKEQSGGQHLEQTIHTFDTARYLFGEVASVHAVSSTGLMTEVPNYSVEDASAVNLQFESGLCGTIFSACFLNVGQQNGMEIWCKDLKIDYVERASVQFSHAGGDREFYTVKNDPRVDLDETFIEAVAKKDQSLLKSSYGDAVDTLEVVLAASESMETGEAVQIG